MAQRAASFPRAPCSRGYKAAADSRFASAAAVAAENATAACKILKEARVLAEGARKVWNVPEVKKQVSVAPEEAADDESSRCVCVECEDTDPESSHQLKGADRLGLMLSASDVLQCCSDGDAPRDGEKRHFKCGVVSHNRQQWTTRLSPSRAPTVAPPRLAVPSAAVAGRLGRAGARVLPPAVLWRMLGHDGSA